MRKLSLFCALLVAACQSPSEPKEAADDVIFKSLSAGNSLYVLSSAENQTSAPIVTVDLQCAGGRVQHSVHDSLSLGADGTARRAFRLNQLNDGQTINTSHLVAVGTWTPYNRADAYYYKDGPSIELHLAPENYNGTGYVMWFRFKGSEALTNLSPMGGSCPGFSDPARHAEFAFNRR